MALQTFWYPRIDYPGGRLDLDAVYRLKGPRKTRVGSSGISASGLHEGALDRFELTVSLVLWPLTKTLVDELTVWWDAWAGAWRPSTLILDRLGTCTTQAEYRYNQAFTRAILITDPFDPQRVEAAVSRPLYSISLDFRQDGGAF